MAELNPVPSTVQELIDQYGSSFCGECLYYDQYTEWHEYGSTMAGEELWECHALRDEDCPALQKLKEEL